MSYRFPEYTYDAASLVDPDAFRGAVGPAWEELDRLGEHNIDSPVFTASQRGTATFYDFHYEEKRVDPGIDDGTGQYYPLAGNGFRVPDTGQWVQCDTATVTWDGSDDRVWALGWAQYGIVDSSFSLTQNPESKARIQFALSINGVLQELSISGREPGGESHVYYTGRGAAPVAYPITDSYTTDCRELPQVSAPGFHVGCVRIQHIQSVPAGPVEVQLLVRRVQPTSGASSDGSTPIYVFSHKLLAIQIKDGPERTGDVKAASFSWPDFGATYNAASVTGPMNAIAGAYNDLEAGNILTEGLRYEHAPAATQISSALQDTIIPAAPVSTNVQYPGWTTDGQTGWTVVSDGAGNNLELSGPWNYTTTPAFVLLLGNINMTKVSGTTAANYGLFCINQLYVDTTGTQKIIAMTNNPNVEPTTVTNYESNVDVPLLEWYDYRASPPAAGPVDKYRMTATAAGSGAATVYWTRGSLQAIHFKT